ncbi:MAG: hypothetical protein ABI574_02475 [Burkholderiales bacterium]
MARLRLPGVSFPLLAMPWRGGTARVAHAAGARWGGWAAALFWGAFAATAVYWGLKLLDRATPVPVHAQVVGLDQVLQGDAARLFASRKRDAAAPTAPSAGSRFKLHGLVASAQGAAGGVVSLSIDGGPPRAYRQGDRVDGDWVVQSISQRAVQLGLRDGPAAAVLEAPLLRGPAVGTFGAAPAPQEAAGIDRAGGNGVPISEMASPPPPGSTDQPPNQAPNQAPMMMEPPPAAGPAAGPAVRSRAAGASAASAAVPSSQR